MKAIIIGLGVQGKKRKKILGKKYICSVDTNGNGDYTSIKEVPLNLYDTVFICTPDSKKIDLIKYCLKNKKNVLVEKPLVSKKNKHLSEVAKMAKEKKVFIKTAYNHRFEPAIIGLKKIIGKKTLGKIYNCRIFYGNGTAFLVKRSKWRDKQPGIITDLGSHLIDIALFLFKGRIKKIKLIEFNKFENKSFDQAIIFLMINNIKINLEMTYSMWKNSFYCDVIGSKGSAHIESLCKWSKSKLIFRKRILPSGEPIEKINVYNKGDPTWAKENVDFEKSVKIKKKPDLKKDIIINNCFNKILKK